MATIRKRRDRWQAQVRLSGARPVSKSFHHKRDAELWAKAQERAIQLGELAPATLALGSGTVGQLLDRYREECVSRKRCAEYEDVMVRALRRSELADVPLAELGPLPFARYRDRRLASVGPAVVRRELGLLHHMFEVAAREWGVRLPRNPLATVTKPREPEARQRRLREGEETHLLAACARSTNPAMRPMIVLALETAMRRGELLNIRRDDMDAAQRTLRIPLTKNGHARTVPLTARALATLEGLPADADGRLLPTTANGFRLAWQRLLRRARIADLHFHDLRHEAVSRFFERGLNVPEVALISGHRDVRMLHRYTHLRAADVAAKLSGLEEQPFNLNGRAAAA